MQTEIISVGTEILMGTIVNTNAAYLSRECTKLGYPVCCQQVVGDTKESIIKAVKTASGRAHLLILTGGLGPTKDDLTKDAVAEALGMKLMEDLHTKERIRKYLEPVSGKEIPENNWKQAMILEHGIVLDNENGTAPGMIVKQENLTVILLPGPPRELEPMFQSKVVPYLEKEASKVVCSKTVKLCSFLESQVEMKIKDLTGNQGNPSIATYARLGEVDIMVTASGKDEQEAEDLIRPVVKELKKRFGEDIFTTDASVSLEECVVKLLKKHELSFIAAESCTGGLVASTLINVPGASDVIKQSFITYSNKAKRKYLDVSEETLKKYTEYSAECAKEMARGAAINGGCDVAVSVTGIAGPGGGTKEKPVGLVYIGCYINGKVTVKECRFQGNREIIRKKSQVSALDLVRRCVLENYK